MFDKIDKLRKKPEPYRKKIAFIASVFITGIIFLIWLSTLGVRFNDIGGEISTQEEKSMLAEVKEGFSKISGILEF